MNCNEIREKISCMLDGQLSAEDSAIVAEHLAECPECMRAFEAFHAISIAMEELEDVPAGFTEDVMTRIRKSNTTPTPKKRPMSIFRTAGMVAAAACAALVLMAGTKFANTHMYVGGGTADTAEYVHLQRATPTPAATQQISFISDNAAVDNGSDAVGYTNIEDAVDETETNVDPMMTMTVDLTAQPPMAIEGEAPLMDPTESTPPMSMQAPVPPPAVTATPIPQMELLFVEDL
ncbi:MAG: zf-HC2 domain-containing protein, partial [Oscillospiraceae bacterium]|nr:zf-HC2 domain-containing protein [Oscillospiraceae bacterium]